jgi:hypothetical protein
MFKQQLNITIFMIIQLINMNIGLREYPVEGKVTESPDFPLSLGLVILIIKWPQSV